MASQPDQPTTQQRIERYLRPERYQTLDPFTVLSFCPVNLHDRVADIGCGPGYFTVPMAKFLVNGWLYALDTDDEMLEACRDRVNQAHMGNVDVLKCGEFDFPLEHGSLDGVFLAFVVHHSPDKIKMLRSVRELLRPRAWCSVLEWYPKETEEGPPVSHRIEPADLEVMAGEAGFLHRGTRNLNADQYMTTLRNT